MKRFAVKTVSLAVLGLLLGCMNVSVDSANPEPLFLVKQGGKYGYINALGEVIIAPQYQRANAFSEGRATVCTGSDAIVKCGFIDDQGQVVIQPVYDSAFDFHEGMAQVAVTLNGIVTTQFIDKQGRTVIDLHNGFALFAFSNGLVPFTNQPVAGPQSDPHPLYGFMDKAGKTRIAPRFEVNRYTSVPVFHNGIAPVAWKDAFVFIDRKGKRLFRNKTFLQVRPFQEGLAAVMDDSQHWGYINEQGRYVIRPQFADAASFSEGLAEVQVNGKYGYVNKKGKLVIPANYEETTAFSEGLAAVKTEDGAGAGSPDKWAYINPKGHTVIEPAAYDYAAPFANGLAQVYYDIFLDPGYINKQGTMVWHPSG